MLFRSTLLIHLGMSGHLRVVPRGSPAEKHDHLDIVFGEQAVRMTDPRRFGAVLWHDAADTLPLAQHALLKKLGVEPLDDGFDGEVLYQATRKRQSAIKQVLLAGDIVVGVGNIYACEAMFRAHISPRRLARTITGERADRLAAAVRAVLEEAVAAGLPRDIATKLAAQTVLGAAKMVLVTGQHPGALKDQVTSPGGTTIEGLHELEKGKLRGTVMSAVRAATEKSKRLGQG